MRTDINGTYNGVSAEDIEHDKKLAMLERQALDSPSDPSISRGEIYRAFDNHRRTSERQALILTNKYSHQQPAQASAYPDPDAALHRKQRAALIIERARANKDHEVEQVLAIVAISHVHPDTPDLHLSKPKGIGKALGWDVTRVTNAIKRLETLARQVDRDIER